MIPGNYNAIDMSTKCYEVFCGISKANLLMLESGSLKGCEKGLFYELSILTFSAVLGAIMIHSEDKSTSQEIMAGFIERVEKTFHLSSVDPESRMEAYYDFLDRASDTLLQQNPNQTDLAKLNKDLAATFVGFCLTETPSAIGSHADAVIEAGIDSWWGAYNAATTLFYDSAN